MSKKLSLLVCLTSLMVAFWGCSNEKVAGTVTDTGNTIAESQVTGVVLRVDGTPAAEAMVRMARMAVFDSVLHVPEQIEVLTDSNGVYAFDSALSDTFQLAVIDTSAVEVFFLPRTTLQAKALDSIKLSKAAVVNFVLYFEDVEDSAISVGGHFMTCLSGTVFCDDVYARDSIYMLIPAGDWNLEFFPADSMTVARMQSLGFADSLIFRNWDLNKVKAGDTVTPGPFMWSTTTEVDTLIKESEKEAENVARIAGKVFCKNGSPCADVEVMLIKDIYGFNFVEGDSMKFEVQTTTDSLGRWWLPVPDSLPGDSFRVEFRKMQDDLVTQVGLSRYMTKKDIENLKDTLKLKDVTLSQPSALNSGVKLVIDNEDSTQSSDCMVHSVVVGIKGTSHFVRDATCNLNLLTDLPAGSQKVILYSGIPKAVEALRKSDVPFVSQTSVTLKEMDTQKVLWLTYTPPNQNIFK